MAYVDLYLKMDTNNIYDKSVLKLIKDIPESQRKDFVISALLYYSKSPSYLTDLKMEEMLKALNEQTVDDKDSAEKKIILTVQAIVEKTIKAVLKNELKNIRVLGSSEKIEEEYSDSVMADEVFEALAKEMVI
jgi:hypothetical protein